MNYNYILYVYYAIAINHAWGATLKSSTLHRIKRNQIDEAANTSMIAKDFFKLHADNYDTNKDLNKFHNDLPNTSEMKKEIRSNTRNATNGSTVISPRNQSARKAKQILTKTQISPLTSKSLKSSSELTYHTEIPIANEPHVVKLFDEGVEREIEINNDGCSNDHHTVVMHHQKPFFNEPKHFKRIPSSSSDHNIKGGNEKIHNNNNINNDNIDKNDNTKYKKNWILNENQFYPHQHQQIETIEGSPASNSMYFNYKLQKPLSDTSSLQLWNPTMSNTFSQLPPIENFLKLANMLVYKVGMDKPQFHATDAQLFFKPNYDVNRGNPNAMLSITSTTNEKSNANANAAPGNELDDLNGIDYVYNSIDNIPPVYSIPHSVIIQPAFAMPSDATQPFNLLESALNMLMGGDDAGSSTSVKRGDDKADDKIEMHCPVNHDQQSDRDIEEEKSAERDSNGLIQVCSCRLINNGKKLGS